MTPMELDYALWIKRRGGRFRLRDLSKTRFIYEYRKSNTHLRQEWWSVNVKLARLPGSNLYTVIPPSGDWSILPVPTKRHVGRPSNEEVRLTREPYLKGLQL